MLTQIQDILTVTDEDDVDKRTLQTRTSTITRLSHAKLYLVNSKYKVLLLLVTKCC